MYDGLSDTPHHCMSWKHAETAMLVNKCNCRRWKQPQGAGDDSAHKKDHDTVEFAQLMPPKHWECNKGGNTVQEDGGDEAPHKNSDPK